MAATLRHDGRDRYTLTVTRPAFAHPVMSAVIDRANLVTEHTVVIELPWGWRPEHGLKDTLYWRGWEVASAPDLAILTMTDSCELTLTRNKRGQLEDQAEQIWAGVSFDDTATPYAAAVAAALDAAGIRVADWDVQPDEDRRIYITLAKDGAAGGSDDPEDEDELRWIVAWIDTHGWFTFLEPARGKALGSGGRDLYCAVMATPSDVVAEVRRTAAHGWLEGLVDTATTDTPDRWTPPAGYVEDPEITGEATDIILDLERSLMAYRNHPAWLAHAERKGRQS